MRRSTKVFGFVFVLFGLLIAFQNCGRAPMSQDSPLDDRVTKIEQLDDTDDKVVLAEIQSFFLFDSQAAATDDGKDIINQIEVCRKSLGEEKRSCIWDVVLKYYSLLKDNGWSVSSEKEGCLFAASSSAVALGDTTQISATCRSLTTESTLPHAVHLDECLDNMAVLPLKRARFFQHARMSFSFKSLGDKKLELFIKESTSNLFIDACGKEHELRSLALSLPVSVKK